MVVTEEQLKIVKATEPMIAVIGPPGTGKTRVLTERIKHLLNKGVKPENIVAITFTNFAANEMINRLPNCKGMFIGTMHSYAALLLRKNGIAIDIDKMVEEKSFDKLIKMATNELYLRGQTLNMPYVQYLFVDEVQDLCDYEFEFISQIPCENMFLGGDADQCIYQFKGAKPSLFNDYCRKPSTKLYTLTKNFRCGQNIVQFSQYFLKDMHDRIDIEVTGNLAERGWVTRTSFEEAVFNLYGEKNYGNWFILTRTNNELEEAGKTLETYNIPFTSFKQGDFTNEEIEKFLRNDEVKLLTIHSAKGLEADNVIVIGCRNWSSEEKCIEYVAATRARKRVFWCPTIVSASRFKAARKTTQSAKVISWE